MGHNLDLHHMIGAPRVLPCPRCNNIINTYFDDYDIDCGEPNPQPGVWFLDYSCDTCDEEFVWNMVFEVQEPRCKGCELVKPLLPKSGMCAECLDEKMSEIKDE